MKGIIMKIDRRKEPLEPSLVYVVSILGLVFIAILSITLIIIFRPQQDNDKVIILITGFVGPTIIALIGILKVLETKNNVKQFKSAVDGNLRNAIVEEISHHQDTHHG